MITQTFADVYITCDSMIVQLVKKTTNKPCMINSQQILVATILEMASVEEQRPFLHIGGNELCQLRLLCSVSI